MSLCISLSVFSSVYERLKEMLMVV